MFDTPLPSSSHAFRPFRPIAMLPAIRPAEDIQMTRMRNVFARHGGMLDGDDAARALRDRASQPVAAIARWIVAREIVHLVHHACILIPMFQFDPQELKLRPGVREAVLELRDAFDDWELCVWFASPNGWLGGATPVDRLAAGPDEVIQAARADRFVALG